MNARNDSTTLVVITTGELGELIRERVALALAEHDQGASAPALLDRRGLALALGCGLDTIDRLRREGCPELRVGDAPRFALTDVLAWLRGRETADNRLPQPTTHDDAAAENGSREASPEPVAASSKKHGRRARVVSGTSAEPSTVHRFPGEAATRTASRNPGVTSQGRSDA